MPGAPHKQGMFESLDAITALGIAPMVVAARASWLAAPIVIFCGLAHTRRAKEGWHMAVRKSRKRRSAMRRSPVQKRSKALSSLKKMRSHDPHTRPDHDRSDARASSAEEAGSGRSHAAATLQQPKRIAPSAAPIPADLSPGRWKGVGRLSASRRLPIAIMLPGLAFVTMGRPVPGLICYALQASVVGWLPAALWATYVIRHGEQKQRRLAARLRSN